MKNNNERTYLTIAESAEKSGMSQFYIRNGVKSGTIPHIKCGTKYLVNYPKMMQYLDSIEYCETREVC